MTPSPLQKGTLKKVSLADTMRLIMKGKELSEEEILDILRGQVRSRLLSSWPFGKSWKGQSTIGWLYIPLEDIQNPGP